MYIFGILSAIIALITYIPYGIDILKGRVRPSRSSRIMLTLITIAAVLQQYDLESGWALSITVAELIGSLTILSISMSKGIGGLTRLDSICYVLLAVDVCLWLLTDSSLLALHLSIAADFIAFAPTLVKSWSLPKSETPIFYVGGVLAAVLSAVAASSYSYAIIVFPLYLAAINLAQLLVMYRSTFARVYQRSQKRIDDTLGA